VLDGKRVAVVVPAHDEEKPIAETIRSIPDFVDRILVGLESSCEKWCQRFHGCW
jgi:hypothetical protein